MSEDADVTPEEARRVIAEISALSEGVTTGEWWKSMVVTPVDVFAGQGSGEDLLVASEMSLPDATLIAAAPKLLAVTLATLDAHPEQASGECGGLCQDSHDFRWPCSVVQDVVLAWKEVK